MDYRELIEKLIRDDSVKKFRDFLNFREYYTIFVMDILKSKLGLDVSDGLGLYRNRYGEFKERHDKAVYSVGQIVTFLCRHRNKTILRIIRRIPVYVQNNIHIMTKFLTPYYIRTPDIQDKIQYIISDGERVKEDVYKLKNDCQWKGEVKEESEDAAIHPRNKMVLFRRNRVLTRRLLRKQSKLNAQPIV